MNLFKLTAFTVMSMMIFSCRNNDAKESFDKLSVAEPEKAGKPRKDYEGFFSDSAGTPQVPGEKNKQQSKLPEQQPKQDWDKKIIKTASLNLEIKDYNAYYSSLREKVRNAGGYIAQEDQSQSDYKIENTISIKVPVDQFDNTVSALTANVEKLNEKKVSSQDVTAEFVDTKSRMEARKQVRQRYMDLLKQAKNMEEILSVQSEINGIQEQIESGLGRIEYLSHSSAFSTINLTYYQVLNSSAKEDSSPSFGTRITNAFKVGWNFMSDLFIGLLSVWPFYFLILLAIIAYKKLKSPKPKQV